VTQEEDIRTQECPIIDTQHRHSIDPQENKEEEEDSNNIISAMPFKALINNQSPLKNAVESIDDKEEQYKSGKQE
jgi:hypothetical protein